MGSKEGGTPADLGGRGRPRNNPVPLQLGTGSCTGCQVPAPPSTCISSAGQEASQMGKHLN